MTWWMILLIILAVLWLLLQIRFGARAGYGEQGITVLLKLGPFSVRMLPRPEGEKPQKKKKEKASGSGRKKEPSADEQKGEKPGTFTRLMDLLPVVCETLGALKRRIRIDDLSLSVGWGGENDPAAAAIGFGRAHAAIGMIWPVLDHNFKVKRSRFHVDVDYASAEPVAAADAAVSMTLWQILFIAVRCGLKLLIRWAKSGRPATK